jgi:peroxiredoxin
MPNLTCSYCRRSDLDPQEEFCPACGAPLEPPSPTEAAPDLDAPPDFDAPPDLEAPPAPFPTEVTPRKKLPALVWLAGGLAALCLLTVLCAVAVATVFVPVLRQQSRPQIPVVEMVYPSTTPRRPEPVEPPTQVPEVVLSDPIVMPTEVPIPTPTPIPSPTPRPEGRPYVGELAPEFTLLDANSGEAVTLSAFTGQPVLVHFWATWCTYCEEEFEALQTIYESYQADGLVILAVDYEDRRSDVVDYGISHQLTFPLLLDENGDITDNSYRVNGFPTTFFLFPDGRISFIQIGTMTDAEFQQQLDGILTP